MCCTKYNMDRRSSRLGISFPFAVQIPFFIPAFNGLTFVVFTLSFGECDGQFGLAFFKIQFEGHQGMAFFVLVKTGLCFQFVLGSILMAKKVRYFALLTSFIVLIYSAVVIRTVGLLI